MTTSSKPPVIPGEHQQTDRPDLSAQSKGVDVVLDLWNRFVRFGWDIVGVIVLVVSLVLLLGLVGFSRGLWISPLVFQVNRWLGWGSYLFVILSGGLGIYLIFLRRRPVKDFPLRVILSIEGCLFPIACIAFSSRWGFTGPG